MLLARALSLDVWIGFAANLSICSHVIFLVNRRAGE